MRLDIQYASSVLCEAVNRRYSLAARLKAAAEQRKDIHTMIKAGERPGGYRFENMEHVAMKILECISGSKDEFDSLHPQDCFTIGDALDALSLAMNLTRRMEVKSTDDKNQNPTS
jgi:hypothetical protein